MANCRQKLKEAEEALRVMKTNYEFQKRINAALREEVAKCNKMLASYHIANRKN